MVIGSSNAEAAERVAELYRSFDCPVIVTDLRTAEMIKYASNAFLATRISFINEIATICEALDADVEVVAHGMGLDARVGPAYLNAGLGWGGSCFPKDVRALEHMGSVHGAHPQLLRAVIEINRDARRSAVRKLREALGGLRGRDVAILGLSFKPNTDDVRDAPAIEIAHLPGGHGGPRAARPGSPPEGRGRYGALGGFDRPRSKPRRARTAIILAPVERFRELDWRCGTECLDVLVVLRTVRSWLASAIPLSAIRSWAARAGHPRGGWAVAGGAGAASAAICRFRRPSHAEANSGWPAGRRLIVLSLRSSLLQRASATTNRPSPPVALLHTSLRSKTLPPT